MRSDKFKAVLIFVLITVALMTACGSDDSAKRAENEQKLFKAITEYPGEGLYDLDELYIGLGTEEPTDEDYVIAEAKATEEREAWNKAVGDCFADGMFDTFYGEWFRNEYLEIARSSDLTTTMTDFKVEENEDRDDNVEEVIVTIMAEDAEGGKQSFDMYWQVIFDKVDRSLIQKVELFDDGCFYNTYADPTAGEILYECTINDDSYTLHIEYDKDYKVIAEDIDGPDKGNKNYDGEADDFINNLDNSCDSDIRKIDQALREYFEKRGETVTVLSHSGLEF